MQVPVRFPDLGGENRAHMIKGSKSVNFVVLQMNCSADLTFASFSSSSLLKSKDQHTSNKKLSKLTSSKGCGEKNDVVP